MEWIAFAWDLVLELIDRDQTARRMEKDARSRGPDGKQAMRFPVYDITELSRWG